MGVKLTQPTFTGGELSPSLYARVDLARYGSSLRTAKNFIVRPYGGVVNRPGLQFVGATKDSTRITRLIPFIFSNEIAYIIEMGHRYARFIFQGAYVLAESSDAWSNLTAYPLDADVLYSGTVYRSLQGGNTGHQPDTSPAWWLPNPVAQIETSYDDTDLALLSYTQSADVMYFAHQDYAPQELRRLTPNTFELRSYSNLNGPFDTINVEEGITAWTDKDIGEVTLSANADIFTSDMLGAYFYLEEQDLRDQRPWEPGWRNPTVGQLCRSDGKVYRCSAVPALGGATWVQTGTQRPVHEQGKAYDGPRDTRNTGTDDYIVGVEWEYMHAGFGIVKIDGYLNPQNVVGQVASRIPLSCVGGPPTPATSWALVGDGVTKVFAIAGAVSQSESDYTVEIDGIPVGANPFYQVGTLAVEQARQILAQAQGIDLKKLGWNIDAAADTITFLVAPANGAVIDIAEIAPTATGATNIWAHGAWSREYGYLGEVEFFSGRLIFAGTPHAPQTIWMSKSGNYSDFGRSAPIADDDAISVTLNARKQNAIAELAPLDNLLLLTTGGEWKTSAGNEDVLTPSNIAFKPQSYNGAAQIPALVIGASALYVQNRGYVVRDIGYQFNVDGYTGADLTVFSSHLTEGKPLREWAYQQVPYSLVWMAREDGALLCMAYMREQEVIGWTPMQVDGYVESIACVPEPDEDKVYVVVRREVEGQQVRYVERMASRLITDIRESRFLDSMVTYDGRNTSNKTMTVAPSGTWEVGEQVTITASGSTFAGGDLGDFIVLGYQAGSNAQFKITHYTSPTVVFAEIMTPVAVELRNVAVTDWGFARNVIHGLDHLEGRTVGILSDGLVQDEREVSGGQITLDDEQPGVLVHVGLPYTSDFETLEVTIPGGESPRLNWKNVNRICAIVEQTRSIWAGPDFDHLDEQETRGDDVTGIQESPNGPPAIKAGDQEMYIPHDWNQAGRVCIRQSDPLPIGILGIVAEMTGGK